MITKIIEQLIEQLDEDQQLVVENYDLITKCIVNNFASKDPLQQCVYVAALFPNLTFVEVRQLRNMLSIAVKGSYR